ncbi:MAG: lysine--tRNA ligase [bacterium]|nr:lysine--tRNA ligase [bacterium]
MRIDRKKLQQPDVYWARAVAEEVIAVFPDLDEYVVSSGISPSGAIHFGNFREIMTQNAVKLELEKMGKKVKFVFVWDDFDAMRKVPSGVDESYVEHLRKPLSAIPDPTGEYESWAKRHEVDFEKSLDELGIKLEFRYQTEMYQSGAYDDAMIKALQNRHVIAKILLSNMSDKAKAAKEINEVEYIAAYYPVSIFSSFTGKDTTEILSYDGESEITYRCKETGNEETIDIRKQHIVKLNWKTDWAMRWNDMGVNFESAGKDHLSPNGSYDVSAEVVKDVYGTDPPLSLAYEFIGIRGLGAKMSGSTGNSVSPAQLLDIYEVPLLLWLYFRKLPAQRFDLAFDSEIIRQYSDFDRMVERFRAKELNEDDGEAIRLAGGEDAPMNPIPFRQAIAFGQIVQWDVSKVVHMMKELEMEYDESSVITRLKKAQAFLETYNSEEMISLLGDRNMDYVSSMSDEQKKYILRLREYLATGVEAISEIEKMMYEIPKEDGMDDEARKQAQRSFFKDVYNLLISKDTGPRLSTFLWAVDREKVLELLTIS